MKKISSGTFDMKEGLEVSMRQTMMCGWDELMSGRNYKSNRMNGDDLMDAPKTKIPLDGKITWVKGRVDGDYIYGVRNGDRYEYECKYDEGPGDKKWMEECDRNYLARLFLLGASTPQEKQDLAENKEQAEKAAKEVEALPINQLSAALKPFIEKQIKERQEREQKEREQKERERKERERKERERQEKEFQERVLKAAQPLQSRLEQQQKELQRAEQQQKEQQIRAEQQQKELQARLEQQQKEQMTQMEQRLAFKKNNSHAWPEVIAARNFAQMNQLITMGVSPKHVSFLAVAEAKELEAHRENLRKQGAIFTLEDLNRSIEEILKLPQEVQTKRYRKNLMAAIHETLDAWKEQKLVNNKALNDTLDHQAFDNLCQVHTQGLLTASLNQRFQKEIQQQKEAELKRWKEGQLDAKLSERYEKEATQTILEAWQKHREAESLTAWVQQLNDNEQELFYVALQQDDKDMPAALKTQYQKSLREKLLKLFTNPETEPGHTDPHYPLYEEFINTTQAVIQERLAKKQVISDMGVIYKQVADQLLLKWQSKGLSKDAEQVLKGWIQYQPICPASVKDLPAEEGEGKASVPMEGGESKEERSPEKAEGATQSGASYHQRLGEEALRKFIQQYRSQNLSSVSKRYLEETIQAVIDALPATHEQTQQGLKAIWEDWRNHRLSKDDQDFLWQSFTARWTELEAQLKPVSLISQLQNRIVELESKIDQLTQALLQNRTTSEPGEIEGMRNALTRGPSLMAASSAAMMATSSAAMTATTHSSSFWSSSSSVVSSASSRSVASITAQTAVSMSDAKRSSPAPNHG